MPTYEFACPEGHEFDKFYRSIAAAPTEVPCPECGRTATRRVSGGAGLLFKGSGFYITDYGKDGKKDLKSAASRPSDASKPAAKSDTPAAPSTPPSSSKSGE
jgi:putative FmdB family regulatory protein